MFYMYRDRPTIEELLWVIMCTNLFRYSQLSLATLLPTLICFFHQQEPSAEVLCSAVEAVAQAICPDLMPSAKTVHNQFKKAITLFDKCHNLYNSGVLTNSDINQLGKQM